MPEFLFNRRKEDRTSAQGAVRLFPDSFSENAVDGQLLDVSASGFRAIHSCTALSGGEVVRFQHQSRTGRARVVWTRIVSGQAESGFLFLKTL